MMVRLSDRQSVVSTYSTAFFGFVAVLAPLVAVLAPLPEGGAPSGTGLLVPSSCQIAVNAAAAPAKHMQAKRQPRAARREVMKAPSSGVSWWERLAPKRPGLARP